MPRKPRIYLPGIPSHVIQRGNNRTACFFTDQDYRFYLKCLDEARRKYKVAVHAYVLMTNHVHLLMTPDCSIGISRLIQSIGRRYVQYINRTYRRSGTLWESRHIASLIQADNYLLTCYRYIELNPVRAGMVSHPGDYPWSSYRYHAYGELNQLIEDHPLYCQLDNNQGSPQAAYRDLYSMEIGKASLLAIRKAVNFSMPLGNDRFREEVEQTLGRKLGQNYRGRPSRKSTGKKDDQ